MTEEEIQRRLDEGEDLVMEDDEEPEPISPVTKAAVAKDVAAASKSSLISFVAG